MHIGLMMECDYREGKSPEEAFDEAFSVARWAEELDFDGVWLAERHFAPPAGAEGIPSVVASPLIFASAIAARTERIRVGTAVLVLPLGHPVRMAEEVATVDHISGGRFDLGVGRSSFPGSYQGYDVPYGESRDRFQEYLQVMRTAWTQDRFSYEGKYYTFDDVCLIPKPFQQPHPPLRVAVTTRDSFPVMGELGLPVFVGLRSMAVGELAGCVRTYREAWSKAGHAGEGDVVLRMPVHVAESTEKAIDQAEASTLHSIARIRRAYIKSVDKVGEGEAERSDKQERLDRADRLAETTYEDMLRGALAYGSPDAVTEKLGRLREELGLSGLIMEPNLGGRIPTDQMRTSMELFAREVAPALAG